GVAINPEFFIDLEKRSLLAFRVYLIRNKQGYGVRPENTMYHYVVRGDTPSKIAQRYGIALRDLKKWNAWTGSIRLRKGQAVRIQPPDIFAQQ
ncbi:MAG: LysM peptidoglycan-binding domain-containing protein, partial [Bacteroidia bacterium]